MVLRATQKLHGFESSFSGASRPTQGSGRQAIFDDTDFAGA
jgi:hypothetical protein